VRSAGVLLCTGYWNFWFQRRDGTPWLLLCTQQLHYVSWWIGLHYERSLVLLSYDKCKGCDHDSSSSVRQHQVDISCSWIIIFVTVLEHTGNYSKCKALNHAVKYRMEVKDAYMTANFVKWLLKLKLILSCISIWSFSPCTRHVELCNFRTLNFKCSFSRCVRGTSKNIGVPFRQTSMHLVKLQRFETLTVERLKSLLRYGLNFFKSNFYRPDFKYEGPVLMYLVNFETSCKFTQFLNSITNINQRNVCVRTTLKLKVTMLRTTTQNHLKTANNCNIDFDAM
jgi:hypothetical protein